MNEYAKKLMLNLYYDWNGFVSPGQNIDESMRREIVCMVVVERLEEIKRIKKLPWCKRLLNQF